MRRATRQSTIIASVFATLGACGGLATTDDAPSNASDGGPPVQDAHAAEDAGNERSAVGIADAETEADATEVQDVSSDSDTIADATSDRADVVLPPQVRFAKAVAAGDLESYVIQSDGTLLTFGRGNPPVPAFGLTNIVQVVSRYEHSCAVDVTGGVVCWGANRHGELGNGTPNVGGNTPVAFQGVSDAIGVAAGSYFTCVLRSTGHVLCVGANDVGQLGNGAASSDTLIATEVVGLTDAVEVCAGSHHACARRQTGEVTCWGGDDVGQLGQGGSVGVPPSSPTPLTVRRVYSATSLGCGQDYAAVVTNGGLIYGWGVAGYGALGPPAGADTTAHPFGTVTDALSLSASWFHQCVIRTNNVASCIGNDGNGQLGDDHTSTVGWFATVPLDNVLQISTGEFRTCAVFGTNRLACWGAAAGPDRQDVAHPVLVDGF